MRPHHLLPAAAVLLGLAAGCGSSSSTPSAAIPSSSVPSVSTPTAPASSASSSTAAGPVLHIRSFTFDALTVAPGAKITVSNDDSVPHTATLATAKIDIAVDPNATGVLTAPSTPGSYPLTCDIHPSMHGTLTVK